MTRAASRVQEGRLLVIVLAQAEAFMALRHAAMEEQRKGRRGLVEMRKHAAFYVRGFPNAARLRARAVKAETLEDFKEILT